MNQYSVFSQSQNFLCFLALITYTVGDRGNGNPKQQKQVIDFIFFFFQWFIKKILYYLFCYIYM